MDVMLVENQVEEADRTFAFGKPLSSAPRPSFQSGTRGKKNP